MRVFVFLLTVLLAGSAFAQSDAAPATNTPAFTQPELDQMLAPVALYPDPLLTEVLTAATYPLEIVEAARWSQANPELTGTDAVDAASAEPWDQNVKALLAFPDLLQMMSDQIDWTQRLGDAFLDQQAQVIDTVQNLRQRAEAAGTLRSDERDQRQPRQWPHRHRTGRARSRLPALLRPHLCLRLLVVAGVSAGVLGGMAGLRLAGCFCVGQRRPDRCRLLPQ